jgi:hypothetical protein
VVLEREQPLSASLLWRTQRAFFEEQAVNAWRRGTLPQYITTNPFIARAYARLAVAFLKDLTAPPSQGGPRPEAHPRFDSSSPVYVVELGAGSGRFAFHFARQARALLRDAGLGEVRLRYVMTDFAEPTLESWQTHPQLQPLIEQGLLDLARFDAGQPASLELLAGGEVLSPGTGRNPLIVIANYCFDSLPADAFWVEGGELQESLVTVFGHGDEPAGAPPDLEALELAYTRRPAMLPYYGEPELDRILDDYATTLAQTAVLFPVAALRCLNYLRELAGGSMLLLVGDKGFGRTEELVAQREPALSVHGGCFSLPVNFHALAEWSRGHGGEALNTRHRPAFLDVWAFPLDVGATPALRTVFDQVVAQGGPDDTYALTEALEPRYSELTLPQMLALLRFTGSDSRVFQGCFPALRAALRAAPARDREGTREALLQVWDAYFHLGSETDVAFLLATLFFDLGDYRQALELLSHSTQLCGPNAGTSYNVALCHYHRLDFGHALSAVEETLALDPAFEQASTLRVLISSELARR